MAKKLTTPTIEQFKPGKVRREIADGGCSGLYLVIQPSGAKSWALRFRSPKDRDEHGQRKARKLTLGSFTKDALNDDPEIGKPLTLEQARKLASDALLEVARKVDPTHTRRQEKAAEAAKAKQQASTEPDTIDAAMVEFMKRHVRKRNGKPIRMSTRIETARLLGLKPDPEKPGEWVKTGRGVLVEWSGHLLKAKTRADVRTLVADIAEDAPVGANRTLAALKTFFTWCVKWEKLDTSPAAAVDNPSPEDSPARALEDHELAALWRACETEGYPFGRYYQLAILVGQRAKGEVRRATRNQIDSVKAVWQIPDDVAKNGHAHIVPLAPQAIAIIESLPRIGKRGLLFTTTGDTPISGLSRAKARIKEHMDVELKKAGFEPQPWRPHDLRHTLKTWMQATRVEKDVRNAVQNHHDRDMDELYGHYSFEAEKRAALEAWARHVDGLVRGIAPAKVIPMVARAAT